jgi:acyl-CoA thioesterase
MEQEKNNMPRNVVGRMMENDFFSQWLGIEVEDIKEGYCKLKLKVRKEMLNGFGIAHGGIFFSLADSALAFASNSRNQKSLVLDASITFTRPLHEGDMVVAEAEEINVTRSTGLYHIRITNQNNELAGQFKGIVFRKKDQWFGDPA